MKYFSYSRLLFASTALSGTLFLPIVVHAGPAGENVVAGSATVTRPSTTRTQIDQTSQRAIIDWDRFNIGTNEAVEFRQPNVNSVTLNRVVGQNPSTIQGQLTANGTVVLVNPDGILFGPNSKVDTGGLIATTHDIDNQDFLAGRYIFNQSGNPDASIVNEGNITIRESGIAAFVAPGVRNNGVISARLGQIGLASANAFTLDLYGDNLINLEIDDEIATEVFDVATGQPLSTLVDNQGTISADGGSVAIKAVTARKVVDRVINNDGIIEADSVGVQNGMIVLGATTAETKTSQAPVQKVRVAGEIRASGRQSGETGGDVHITGEMIAVPRARIDVTGDAGGGNVLLGGDFQGGRATPEALERFDVTLSEFGLATASNLFVGFDTVIDASALNFGDGGQIIAWSENTTDFRGTINARGGQQSGDAGFAEISGRKELFFSEIKTDLTAPNGANGTILFDPEFLTINRADADNLEAQLNQGQNAVASATRRLTVASNILKTSGGTATLALLGGDGVTINNGVTIGSSSGALNVMINANADVNAANGELNIAAMREFERIQEQVNFLINDPISNPEALIGDELLSALNDVFPDTEQISLSEFVLRLEQNMTITATERAEFDSSQFVNLGGTFALNGGTLSVVENQGTANITGSTIGFTSFEGEDGIEQGIGPFTADVRFTASPASQNNFNTRLPGAFVIDLTPTDDEVIAQEFQPTSFSSLTNIGQPFGQSADQILSLLNGGNSFFVVTETGLVPVSQEEGLDLAQQAAEDILNEMFNFGPDIVIPENAVSLDIDQNGRPIDPIRQAFLNGTDPTAHLEQDGIVKTKLSYDGGLSLEFSIDASLWQTCNSNNICTNIGQASLGISLAVQPRRGTVGVGAGASISAITVSTGPNNISLGNVGGALQVGVKNGRLNSSIKTPGLISIGRDL